MTLAKWDADRLALAERISKHEAPIPMPRVDKALLIKSAKRLQRTVDVVRNTPCDPRAN